MTAPAAFCLDIGSTFTKGALFSLDPERPAVLRQADCPTTQDDLARGFWSVLARLCGCAPDMPPERIEPEYPVRFSSSAKGGLAIAAIGLVPDLTLKAARLAAMSAGGKVVCSFAYTLTRDDVARLEAARPDLLLFCGGTDGGNSAYAVLNARRLAGSRLEAPIVYAGNRDAAGEVAAALHPRPVSVVPNIMPDLDRLQPEPARDMIREIFLHRLIAGKGLDGLARRFDANVRPTPLGVYALIRAISRCRPEWDDLCVLDLGGATTDVYSNTESVVESEAVILRGLREPRLKRTVEGDLGLRVSLRALRDTAAPWFEDAAAREGWPLGDLDAYIEQVHAAPGHVARDDRERAFDAVLAGACVQVAMERHCGNLREVYTPQGRTYVQTGKDLRRVRRVIGSGGYLSRLPDAGVLARALRRCSGGERDLILCPEQPGFFADEFGLFPLLGSLAEDFPEAAAALAVHHLRPLDERRTDPCCRTGS